MENDQSRIEVRISSNSELIFSIMIIVSVSLTRLLAQFSFNLNPLAEIMEKISEPRSPVSKEGVKDMLVKHHLFSWDI